MDVTIGSRRIGESHPTYFIADIASNHDGSLYRAKDLIGLAAEAGADAAKFQNFRAETLVSDLGFRRLSDHTSHQAQWKDSVFDTYRAASIPDDWTGELKAACETASIEYFSAPYDFAAIDMLDPHVRAYKVGSGDITWLEALERIAGKGKPVLLATGASTIGDVQRAVRTILPINPALVLMQCNTNYTGSLENFAHINLRVLGTYRSMFPDVVLGLSDHTPGHATVLGAVALGARAVEKHFTDDTRRSGPDHPFSMDPTTWREMVQRTRELERALGTGDKLVADNERETVVLQRRCVRAARAIRAGEVVRRDMLDVLRPSPPGTIQPWEIDRVVDHRAAVDIPEGSELRWTMLTAATG